VAAEQVAMVCDGDDDVQRWTRRGNLERGCGGVRHMGWVGRMLWIVVDGGDGKG